MGREADVGLRYRQGRGEYRDSRDESEAGGRRQEDFTCLRGVFLSQEWTRFLDLLTRRVAGKAVTVRVSDPEIGYQIEMNGLPFVE